MDPVSSAVVSVTVNQIVETYTGDHLETCPTIIIQTIFEQFKLERLAELLELSFVNKRFCSVVRLNQTGIAALKQLGLNVDTREWNEGLKTQDWVTLYRRHLNTPPPILMLDYSYSMIKMIKLAQDEIHIRRAVEIAKKIGQTVFESIRPEILVCVFATNHKIKHLRTMEEFEVFLTEYEQGTIDLDRRTTDIANGIKAAFDRIMQEASAGQGKEFSLDLISDCKVDSSKLNMAIATTLENHGILPDQVFCKLTFHPTYTLKEADSYKEGNNGSARRLKLIEGFEGGNDPQKRKISIQLAPSAKRQRMVPEVIPLPEQQGLFGSDDEEFSVPNPWLPFNLDQDFNNNNWPF